MSINMNTVIHKHEMIDNFRILRYRRRLVRVLGFLKAVLAFQCVTSFQIVEGFS